MTEVTTYRAPLKRQLRSLVRRSSFGIPKSMRKNFTTPDQDGLDRLSAMLRNHYFPSFFEGVDVEAFNQSVEGQRSLDNHLNLRLELGRYELTPWVTGVLPLDGARILEVGCGTGSVTVALAEQNAKIYALDIHDESLDIAKFRCSIHGVGGVTFSNSNAQDIAETFAGENGFDMIIFFATLEHMTLEERKLSLQAAWEFLRPGQFLCITHTPNRLWFHDGHTSELPFFNWLPDELAIEYSKNSPRYPFNSRFRTPTEEAKLSFIRDGRGFSYHELEVALGESQNYKVRSDLTSFLSKRNPARLVKRLSARTGARERMLNSFAPGVDRGFFRNDIDLILEKVE